MPNSACCLIVDCSAIRRMLAARTPPSSSRCGFSCAHSCAGATLASQSTMSPRNANRSASNAPMAPVRMTVASKYLRKPREHAHMNAKKPRGGGAGGASGIGIDQAFEKRKHAGS